MEELLINVNKFLKTYKENRKRMSELIENYRSTNYYKQNIDNNVDEYMKLGNNLYFLYEETLNILELVKKEIEILNFQKESKITNDLFLELLEENNIKVNARTKGWIKNSLQQVGIENFTTFIGNKSSKILDLAEELNKSLFFRLSNEYELIEKLDNIINKYEEEKQYFINFLRNGIEKR